MGKYKYISIICFFASVIFSCQPRHDAKQNSSLSTKSIDSSSVSHISDTIDLCVAQLSPSQVDTDETTMFETLHKPAPGLNYWVFDRDGFPTEVKGEMDSVSSEIIEEDVVPAWKFSIQKNYKSEVHDYCLVGINKSSKLTRPLHKARSKFDADLVLENLYFPDSSYRKQDWRIDSTSTDICLKFTTEYFPSGESSEAKRKVVEIYSLGSNDTVSLFIALCYAGYLGGSFEGAKKILGVYERSNKKLQKLFPIDSADVISNSANDIFCGQADVDSNGLSDIVFLNFGDYGTDMFIFKKNGKWQVSENRNYSAYY